MIEFKGVGNKLRVLRGKQSTKVVAEALGISVQAWNAYENGTRRPRDIVKARIAKYFKVDVGYLFF